MKKQLFLVLAVATVSMMSFTACGGNDEKKGNPGDTAVAPKKDSTQGQAQAHAYVCPMGEQCGYGEKPGKCSNCGMELVENKTH